MMAAEEEVVEAGEVIKLLFLISDSNVDAFG